MIVKQHELVHKLVLHAATNKLSPKGTPLAGYTYSSSFSWNQLATHVLLYTDVKGKSSWYSEVTKLK